MRPPDRRHDRPPAGLQVKAALLLAGVRVALALLPFAVASRGFARMARRSPSFAMRAGGIDEVVAAVERAGHFVPGARHCLTRAVAAQILLIRRGHPAELCIGVQPDPGAPFPAHAWVESDGAIVIGGADAGERYLKLRS